MKQQWFPNVVVMRPLGGVLVIIAMLFGLMSFVPVSRLAAAPVPQELAWHDTGIDVAPLSGPRCFDTVNPGVVFLNERAGTVAYRWQTGERRVINSRNFVHCGPGGLLFARDETAVSGWRFSLQDPVGQAVDYVPSYSASDGTLRMYALAQKSLWSSEDGGTTWQKRDIPPDGSFESIAVAAADARVLYLLVSDRSQNQSPLSYTIYRSQDGGITWEQRSQGEASGFLDFGGPFFSLQTLPGRITPVDFVQLTINPRYPGSSNRQKILLSGDGARTFNQVGSIGLDSGHYLAYTSAGVLMLSYAGFSYILSLSTDGGMTFEDLDTAPPSAQPGGPGGPPRLRVAENSPSYVFVNDMEGSWYSTDGGQRWQQLPGQTSTLVDMSPYLPLVLLDIRYVQDAQGETVQRLYTLDLPGAGRTTTRRVAATSVPDGRFFPETGHNLSGKFKTYWEEHGGLAQFGYPRTIPLREVNPADGRVYLVQYFERNRFEYHPEYAGTPDAVLLGLLGTQLTSAQRERGEEAFMPVSNPNEDGVLYFPQTGHTLRGRFRRYWQEHGGLELYGYPISEEFVETNPENGKDYRVQYFERNRFEYHPEHSGTSQEVQLGLLGNTLLRQQGWLPSSTPAAVPPPESEGSHQ